MAAPEHTQATDPPRRRSWLAPLLGITFLALFVVAFAGSDDAEPETSGVELIAKHAQSSTAEFVSATALIIAAIVLVFFGGWLRHALRPPTPATTWRGNSRG